MPPRSSHVRKALVHTILFIYLLAHSSLFIYLLICISFLFFPFFFFFCFYSLLLIKEVKMTTDFISHSIHFLYSLSPNVTFPLLPPPGFFLGNIGGGFGIRYSAADADATISPAEMVHQVVEDIHSHLVSLGVAQAEWPHLMLEPGRGIVGLVSGVCRPGLCCLFISLSMYLFIYLFFDIFFLPPVCCFF